MIHVEGVWKAYPGVQALADVSLDIQPGTIHGIFGPNGAGKTTLLKVIAGLTRPDRGLVHVGEVDVIRQPEAARARMGIQLELPAVYDELSLQHYLTFFGRMGGMREPELTYKVRTTMEVLEMSNLARSKVQKFSIGQRQRMEIGRALLHDAPILMLDEPFIALDYEFRLRLQEYLRQTVDQGRIVIVTSHNLAEAKRLIDSYSLISRGVLTDGESASQAVHGQLYHMHTSDDGRVRSLYDGLEGLLELRQEPRYLSFKVDDNRRLPALMQLLFDNNIELEYLEAAGDLEASYRELVHR